MKTKFLALDFDGTILNDKHQISKDLVDCLIELQKQGITVILCSGRNYLAMQSVVKKIKTLDFDTYIVSSNGGEIYQVANGEVKVVHKVVLDEQQVSDLHKLLKDKTKYFYAYNATKVQMTRFNVVRSLMALYFKEIPKYKISGEATKIIVMDSVEHINKIYADTKAEIANYNQDINVFRSVKKGIEITPKLATKGQALKKIFDLNGWSSEQLMVFGDGENDIDMFEYAKYSVAMDNAFEATKAVASHHTDSNNDNGVYNFISSNYDLFDLS